jgi:pyruvate,orthophosphate dikinase
VLKTYLDKDIYAVDPFVSIDREGVGALMRIAVEGGRGARPGMKLGICGEHGGDPSSVVFCHEVGLDYVSCSPYRLPIARLAAAQAALREAAKAKGGKRKGAKARPATHRAGVNGAAARARKASRPRRARARARA